MKLNKDKNLIFNEINGLRVLACMCIVLMHIKANISYSLPGFIPNLIIDQFGNFVFLFMTISAFSMCCGYYNKIKKNEVSVEQFYSKRIKKILPFFLFLILLDVIINHSLSSIIEGFADFTLLFNFIPKEITVIGVGWFLGLIFMFYIIFPYYVYLFSNKRRAWTTTIISILMNISCLFYFDIGRENMFFSLVYFCIGGLIFLYKDIIIDFFKKNRIFGLLFVIISIFIYYFTSLNNEYLMLIKTSLISLSFLCYAISYKSILLNNKITKFLGNISFHIYLCHMVIFKILDRFNLLHVINNNWISYLIVFIAVILGAIVLAKLFERVMIVIEKRKIKDENTTC